MENLNQNMNTHWGVNVNEILAQANATPADDAMYVRIPDISNIEECQGMPVVPRPVSPPPVPLYKKSAPRHRGRLFSAVIAASIIMLGAAASWALLRQGPRQVEPQTTETAAVVASDVKDVEEKVTQPVAQKVAEEVAMKKAADVHDQVATRSEPPVKSPAKPKARSKSTRFSSENPYASPAAAPAAEESAATPYDNGEEDVQEIPQPEAAGISSNDGSISSALMGASTDAPRARTQGLEARPLTRDAVQRTMAILIPKIEACGRGNPGTLTMRFIIDGATGRVISARPHANTSKEATAAQCAARVLKQGQFPTFSANRQAIKYTFQVH
jgi:hypothetical protein